MKKTFSVVLLLVFLYNISGYYLAFTIQQSEIKKTVHKFFEEHHTNDLFLLKISPQNGRKMIWYGNNEFSLDGEMYDVAFKKREGNELFLYCYSDSKENHLNASLNFHIKNNIYNSAAGKNSKNTLKNPLPNYFMSFSKNEFTFFTCSLKKEIQCSFYLLSFCIDKPTPPPRLV